MAENGLRELATKIYEDDDRALEYSSNPSKVLARQVPVTVFARVRELRLRGVPEETREKRFLLAEELHGVANERLREPLNGVASVITNDLGLYYDYLDDAAKALGSFMPWTHLDRRRRVDHVGTPGVPPLEARLTIAVVPPSKVPGLRVALKGAGVESDETLRLSRQLTEATENRLRQNPLLGNLAQEYRNRRQPADYSARMVALHPKLRAKYFADPERVLARQIPAECGPRWLWRLARRGMGTLLETLFRWVPDDTKAKRETLAAEIEDRISLDPRLISGRETFHERETFLRQGMQNPEATFTAVFWMSVFAFLTGIGLLAFGAYLAQTKGAAAAAIFGGAGAVTTIGSLVTVTTRVIRRACGEHAQIRMILTDFASEIAHLRAITIRSFSDAKERNAQLRQLTKDAVALVAAQNVRVEVDGGATEREDARRNGQASDSADTAQGAVGRLVPRIWRQTSI